MNNICNSVERTFVGDDKDELMDLIFMSLEKSPYIWLATTHLHISLISQLKPETCGQSCEIVCNALIVLNDSVPLECRLRFRCPDGNVPIFLHKTSRKANVCCIFIFGIQISVLGICSISLVFHYGMGTKSNKLKRSTSRTVKAVVWQINVGINTKPNIA